MAVKFSEIEYKNFGRCIKVENDIASFIVTVDVGPRVIAYSLNGMENVLYEDVERHAFNQDEGFEDYYYEGAKWYIYGGHRLWYSPEAFPNSYYPDNDPVRYTIDGNTIKLTPKPQAENGVAYTMSFTLDENSSKITASHTITNISDNEMEIAPWCLTVMDKGGIEIIPQSRQETGLLANRLLVIWPYTDITDDRLYIGNDYITLKQDENISDAIKIGVNNDRGWVSYLNKNQLFVKRYTHYENAKYPDFGVSYETYTNDKIMEVESLGYLKVLNKGDSISHDETWELIPCEDSFNRKDMSSVDTFVKKHIEK